MTWTHNFRPYTQNPLTLHQLMGASYNKSCLSLGIINGPYSPKLSQHVWPILTLHTCLCLWFGFLIKINRSIESDPIRERKRAEADWILETKLN